MKKIISYLSIYIFLHGMYLIQGCCNERTCQSVSTLEASYQHFSGRAIDTVAYDSVRLVVTPVIFNATCQKNNPWISSAAAHKCSSDETIAMTRLEKITIIAAEDYSTAFPKDSALNNLFETRTFNTDPFNGELGHSFQFSFLAAPDNDVLLHLTVQFYYEHFSQPFTASLPAIYLKK